MPYFKDKQNKLHFLDDESFIHLLPSGSIKITDKAAEKLYMIQRAPTAEEVISQRNYLLAQSDWTQMPDVSLTKKQRDSYKTYRQALRDITSQPDFPVVIWPELNKGIA